MKALIANEVKIDNSKKNTVPGPFQLSPNYNFQNCRIYPYTLNIRSE